MKYFFTLVLINIIVLASFSQAPQKFAYQSVIRNAGNQLVANQSVGIKISILQGSTNGAAVYTETHSPLTNANGLATLEIGSGTVLSGNFANINWANGPYFVKTETDLNGGSNYTITSTTQLLSVPYALYSNTVSSSVSQTGDTLFIGSQAYVIPGISAANNGGGGNNPLNIETSLIPAGTFTMGSPTTEPQRQTDEVQHQVTLSSFRMSTYETTNAQYAAFLNANNIGGDGIYAAGAYPNEPLIYDCGNGLSYTGAQWHAATGFENHPVVCVTWYGAQEFATYAGGRLPTEAEWEYACRGETTSAFNTGACLNNTQANYNWIFPLTGCTNTSTNAPNQTLAVNSFSPNAYGLYNMHGNVWEWCADWYGAYATTLQTNPTGPTTGTLRLIRGGSFGSLAQVCRSAKRTFGNPFFNDIFYGFRLAFAP